MTPLLQVASEQFNWHLQEVYDSIRPQLQLLLFTLIGYLIFEVRQLRDGQRKNSSKIEETNQNTRIIANGRSVHHETDQADQGEIVDVSTLEDRAIPDG